MEDNRRYEDIADIYLSSLSAYSMTDEEERSYLERIKAGDEEAKNEFIEKNLRLVLKTANSYRNRGLEYMDLIQEGNIGLMKAIEKFDLGHENKFSTYATWWIKQAITRSLSDTGHAIRRPVHFNEAVSKINKMKAYLTEKDGEVPTTEKLVKVLEKADKKLKVEEILLLEKLTSTVSLNVPMNPDGEDSSRNRGELEDFIDNNEPSLTEVVENDEMAALIHEAMATTLTERELRVIKLRFGFNEQDPKTLEEVGKEFGLTRERIRQIEARAINKLRHGKSKVLLKEYDPNYKD